MWRSAERAVPHTCPWLSGTQNNWSPRKQGKESLPWAGSASSEGKSKTIPNLPCLREKRKGRVVMAGNWVTVLCAWKVGQEGQHGCLRGQEGRLRHPLSSPQLPRCTGQQSKGCKAGTSPQRGGNCSLLKSVLYGWLDESHVATCYFCYIQY